MDPASQANVPLRRRLRFGVSRWAAAVLGRLPQGWATQLLRGPAWFARRGQPGRIARANLERILGSTHDSAARRAIEREVFTHTARLAARTAWLAQSTPAQRTRWFAEHVRMDSSMEILRTAYEQGQGVLVVTAHLGEWDVLAAALAQHGYRGSVVGNHRERDPSGAWLVSVRKHYGVTTWPQDVPPKQLLRELREGRLLGLLCDLEVRRLEGEFLPFLGESALTMGAPAALARASGSPIVPIRCVRLAPGDAHLTLLAEAPLVFDPHAAPKAERTRLLTAINEIYGRWILEHPGQWAWYQPRWRTRPGERESLPIAERQRRKADATRLDSPDRAHPDRPSSDAASEKAVEEVADSAQADPTQAKRT